MSAANEKGFVSSPSEPRGSKIMQWIRDVALGFEGDSCLVWPFAREVNGYGSFGRNKQKVMAHRYICEWTRGAPPAPEMHAAHSCDNGPGGCVNPKHLEWKTAGSNQLDRRRTEPGPGQRRKRKLSMEQVDQIRAAKGTESTAETARRFGISEAHARHIQNGRDRRTDRYIARSFTDDEVRDIRCSAKSINELAADYSANYHAISRIVRRKSYRYVPDVASHSNGERRDG